ncbi:hypothetical protein B0H13DRAFT_2329552 [Mycena leptocephala]|nr:hypothetical protein B0H13DRAFT_2329552 [Mycena leptocephala]
MAQRRTLSKPRKAESAAPVEEFDFLASQQSTGSDDHALQLAVAQQLMASKEKKRKELEKKFFQAAKNKLSSEISAAADEVKCAVDATENVYAKFILDYAASEDAIRALWMEIKKEEQTLVVPLANFLPCSPTPTDRFDICYQEIAKKQRAANDALSVATEKQQIAGMAQVKEACHETRRIMESLLPATA